MNAEESGETLRVRCALMRGGTSRGLIFVDDDLPADPELRDLIFLAALGSPDARQLDGVAAGDSHTSKVAVVSRSKRADADVDFLFAEAAINEPRVDYAGNSGNIISAVGLFAVEEGWVPARGHEAWVRVHNSNTGKRIDVGIPIAHGRPAQDGDFHIDGVPGTGPRIELRFPDPGGALTGRLLHGGGARCSLSVPGVGEVEATLIDAANPVVIIDGNRVGVDPCIAPAALNTDAGLLARLQAVRAAASVAFGLVDRLENAWRYSPMVPFLALLYAPTAYPCIGDRSRVAADDTDLVARVLSLNLIHKAINVTVSVALTAAAMVPGSLAHALSATAAAGTGLRIGHPSGVIDTRGELTRTGGDPRIAWVSLGRTARRIMQGEVLVQPCKQRWLRELRAARASD